MSAPSLLIVEDHPLLAQSLALAMGAEGMTVNVLHPEADEDVLIGARRWTPDLVLLDMDLGEGVSRGPLFVPSLRAVGAQVLVVSGIADLDVIAEAIEAGALGYVHKSKSFDDLLEGIRRAIAGESVNDPQEWEAMLARMRANRSATAERRQDLNRLTPREQHVLAALMDGTQVEAIAADAVVSTSTVRSQVKSVLQKLGVSSQLAAVAFAHRSGWTKHD